MKWWYTYNKYIHELTYLILIFFSSFDLTIITNFDRTDKTVRRAARTFWGPGRFLQIRAQIHNSSERLNYMQTLQRPLFKNNYLFPIQIFLVDIQAQSSNVNEVIREVLNSLFFYYCFFFTKRLCTHEKHKKHKDATKQNHNTTHQKHNDATKQRHKTLQANSKGMVVPLHQ